MMVASFVFVLAAVEPPKGSQSMQGGAVVPLLSPRGDDAPASSSHPYLWTGIETALVLGGGTVWYWRSPASSTSDLDFTLGDWRDKMLSPDRTIVFDDDRFDTNALGHPLAGAVYYQLARGNGFGVAASFAASFLASIVWEYLVEFNERPSANDIILTPAGGAVIGESAYRFGRYFARGPSGLVNCIGGALFSPVATLNDRSICKLGNNARADDRERRRFGWSRMVFEAGLVRSSFHDESSRDEAIIRLGADIVAHRAYRHPGAGTTYVRPGQWTALFLNALGANGGVTGIWFHAQTLALGSYIRRYGPRGAGTVGEPNGWGALVGLGSTFDYDTRALADIQDRTASAGLAGPMLEIAARRGPFAVRAGMTTQYGLSMVQSLSYPAAASTLADDFIRSELRKEGYYFAHGLTSAGRLALEAGPVEVVLVGRLRWFWSIDRGLRNQSQINNNFPLSDSRMSLLSAAAIRLFGGPARLAISYEQARQESGMLGQASIHVEHRGALSMSLVF